MKKKLLGPGLLVTAAFIGPGTVVTASRSGAQFGYTLIWAIAFSIIATIVLQEMAARLGIVTGSGLGESLKKMFAWKPGRVFSIVLIISAILIGNAAYQTGNLLGASIGGQILTGADSKLITAILAFVAAGLLIAGRFQLIKNVLVGVVCFMSLLFLLAAILGRPDLSELAKGFRPSIPDGAGLLVVGLIGTTVVPYNLFLHASAVAKTVAGLPIEDAIRHSRMDTWIAVGLGGIVTAAILVTTANAFGDAPVSFSNPAAMADSLRPVLGKFALNLFAMGLLAAGITSAITAPWAAGLATAGCLGWKTDLSDWRTRSVALSVVAVGLVFGLTFGSSPIQAISFAQVANGLLLPLITIYLLIAVNRSDVVGKFRNRTLANVMGCAVLLVTIGLGVNSIIAGIANLLK